MIVPSFVAKVMRAEKHLGDLEDAIARYGATKPYTVRETVEGKKQRKVRRLVFTSDPGDTDIPLIAADAIYNLRSALDHLMAALAPPRERTSVMFPILFQGVWEAIVPGENAQRVKERARWASVVKSLPDEAVAILKEVQPPDAAGEDRETNMFWIVNSLSNRDKHSKLPVLASGLQHLEASWKLPDGTVERYPYTAKPDHFLKHDAELGGIPDDAMDVKVEGTPLVAVRVGGDERYIELPAEPRRTAGAFRERLFPRLAPYVRADTA